jgi:surface protein
MNTKLPIKNLLERAAMTLFVMTALATAAGAQTPYAIFCSDNNTLYFTYRTEKLSEGDTFTPEEEGATAQTINELWSGPDVTETDAPGWYFCGARSNIETVVFEPSFASVRPKSTSDWFYDFWSLTGIKGMENLNTSQVTNMSGMFFECVSLTALDLSSFDTRNVTDMADMFYDCGSLTALDLSSFDTRNVKNMHGMFYDCGSLTALDLSSFDTRNVTDMTSMFYECGSLLDIYIGSGWNTDDVESSGEMFYGCYNLPNFDWAFEKDRAHANEGGYMLMHPMLTIYDDDGGNTDDIDDAIDDAEDRYEDYRSIHADDEAGAGIVRRNNVTLSGRTLYKDGEWNTLCLPFSMTAGQVSASPLAGADIRTLTSASVTGYFVKLTFGKVSSLTSGTPYIVRWKADTENPTIIDPVFNGVTLSDEKHDFTSTDTHVKFIGYYDTFTVGPDDDPAVYYLTAGNMLKHTAKERTLKACRAYFLFTPGDDAGTNKLAFDIDFGDGTTGIAEASTLNSQPSTPFWYTLDGRRLSGKPTQKGIYLNNGRKVVIK